MALVLKASKYNHIYWADLNNNGTQQEIAVVAKDEIGNVWYIPLNAMDLTDKRRMFKLVTDRQAMILPLYEVMANTMLGNGVNALTYFHQLVKLRTPSGQILVPTPGVIGTAAPGAQQPPQQPTAA